MMPPVICILFIKVYVMNLKVQQEQKSGMSVTTIEGTQDAGDFVKFSVIPSMILKDPNLNASEKLVYCVIYTFNSNAKPFFGSNQFIAQSVGLAEVTIQTILNKLENKGYIKREYVDGESIKGRKSIIITYPPTKVPCLENEVDLPRRQGTPLPRNRDHTNKGITKKDKNTTFFQKRPDYQSLYRSSSLFGYRITNALIDRTVESIHDYVRSTGKKYKDITATVRIWIKRDIEAGKIDQVFPKEAYEDLIKKELSKLDVSENNK